MQRPMQNLLSFQRVIDHMYAFFQKIFLQIRIACGLLAARWLRQCISTGQTVLDSFRHRETQTDRQTDRQTRVSLTSVNLADYSHSTSHIIVVNASLCPIKSPPVSNAAPLLFVALQNSTATARNSGLALT